MAKDKTAAEMKLIMIMITFGISVPAFNFPMETPDISLFYSNNSVIRTLKTTMTVNEGCKIDYVNKTTPDHTEFRRVYTMTSSSYYNDFKGIFINMDRTKNAPPYNGMVLQLEKGGNNESIEELVYQSDNYTCGIFSVDLWRVVGIFYELRVKNKSIRSVSPECMSKFLEKAGGANNASLNKETCQ
uniref:Lipocalin n=1 Tax=Rhipicephalus appendiculatus TaxID=34631 RepID=A0A131Z486_RHIAP